ncbi:MAG: hypothetical protein WD046_07195 [Paracoccaceae bacterium]
MVVPIKYHDIYLPVKCFLNSYRALSDGISGISSLKTYLNENASLVYEWKFRWVGICAILRTSVELFRADSRLCINNSIRDEIGQEWHKIKEQKDLHPIFWEFLRKERDNIVHEYKWNAYELWLDPKGNRSTPSIHSLLMTPENKKTIIEMKHGMYKGRDSIELLEEAAYWIKSRIYSAVERAGFNPDEERSYSNFQPRPPSAAFSLLTEGMAEHTHKKTPPEGEV